ncbi:MAG: ATP-binding protein [Bacteroidota bacterium]
MEYIHRKIEVELEKLESQYPVFVITGPRQSGKTTLARHKYPNLPYFSFENPDIRLMALTDPRAFLKNIPNGAILDEVQHVPDLISYLQQIVDENREKTRFILTGSNQFMLMNKITQSLAGRAAILKLLPLSLEELSSVNTIPASELIFIGFYPLVHSLRSDPTKTYRNYYETYLERDLRQILQVKDLSLFQKFVRICAGRIGNLVNASALAGETGVSVATVQSWLSILEASYIIMQLQPFYDNINKRLIKSPKLYFYDTGLACYLLGIENVGQVVRDPLYGALFENMVIMDAVKYRYNKGFDHNMYFYRDSHHSEIDMVYKRANELIPIEIKSSQTYHPDFTKGLRNFSKTYHDRIPKSFLTYDGDLELMQQDVEIVNFRQLTSKLFED